MTSVCDISERSLKCRKEKARREKENEALENLRTFLSQSDPSFTATKMEKMDVLRNSYLLIHKIILQKEQWKFVFFQTLLSQQSPSTSPQEQIYPGQSPEDASKNAMFTLLLSPEPSLPKSSPPPPPIDFGIYSQFCSDSTPTKFKLSTMSPEELKQLKCKKEKERRNRENELINAIKFLLIQYEPKAKPSRMERIDVYVLSLEFCRRGLEEIQQATLANLLLQGNQSMTATPAPSVASPILASLLSRSSTSSPDSGVCSPSSSDSLQSSPSSSPSPPPRSSSLNGTPKTTKTWRPYE